MTPRTIPLDIELHRLIEGRRISFEESSLEIVKRVFRTNSAGSNRPETAPTEISNEQGSVRLPRRGGKYELNLLGKRIEVHSLKDVLKSAILVVEREKPGFIEKLALHRTSKGRRIVARRPEEIYPGKPQLVHCAEKLDSRWWYDTNVSKNQCQRYLGVLAQIGGFKEPTVGA
jgi:hypothetical protein